MTISNKILISLIFLLSGCTLGENLEDRYTKETPISAQIRNSDVCLSIPIQNDEIVVSALTYNIKKPSEQMIFPAGKQPKSGLFCIQPGEFRFENGQEYLTYIEVNIKASGTNEKITRKAYISNFQIEKQDDSLKIIQMTYK